MNNFRIRTLSDYNTVLADPFTAIIAAIPGLFNLFSKTKLTMQDLDLLFPGNGYWTVALKQHLIKHIAWKDDKLQQNVDEKMKAFINEVYSNSMCKDLKQSGCFQFYSIPMVKECPECTTRFYNTLQEEKQTGGSSPSGKYPGGLYAGTADWSSIALIGGGLALLFVLANKKKSRRK